MIVEAEDLFPVREGSADAFVRVQFGDQKPIETHTINRSVSPKVWKTIVISCDYCFVHVLVGSHVAWYVQCLFACVNVCA